MKATLCDRCRKTVDTTEASRDPLIRIYLEMPRKENVWREFHLSCGRKLTVDELMNRSWKEDHAIPLAAVRKS